MPAFPRSFELDEPRTMDEAVHALARHAGRAVVLAGGCELLPSIRRGRARPEHVVSLAQIPGLEVVSFEQGVLRIGAMAPLRAVERSPALSRFAALQDGIRSIASVQVRTGGTLVGNLCVATPASDIAPPLRARRRGPGGGAGPATGGRDRAVLRPRQAELPRAGRTRGGDPGARTARRKRQCVRQAHAHGRRLRQGQRRGVDGGRRRALRRRAHLPRLGRPRAGARARGRGGGARPPP